MLLKSLRRRLYAASKNARSSRRESGRREISTFPALVEGLADRTLLAVIMVTNLNDSGGGSLHAAVASANTNPGADTIRFQENLNGTIALTTGQMEITDALTIDGPG